MIYELLSAAGAMAVWVGLYIAGAVVLMGDLVSQSIPMRALVFSFGTGMGVYLLDRVKLTDAMADPSDALAHPKRHRLITRNARWVRVLMALVLVLAVMTGWSLGGWVLGALVCLAILGVLIYGGMPARKPPEHAWRIKDLFLLKNFAVAGSITLFCGVVLVVLRQPEPDAGAIFAAFLRLGSGGLVIGLIVLGDAILCDIDDVRADAKFGTRTIPACFGLRAGWLSALVLQLLAVMCVFVFQRVDYFGGQGLRIWWPTLVVVSTGLLWVMKLKRVRNIVDVRLALIAVLITLMSR